MTISTTPEFCQALRKLGLLLPAQFEVLNTDRSLRLPDPQALAKELVARGWLTPFQANELLLGRGDDLVIGSYVLIERLGEGAMGQVFKARHQTMGRVVALKTLRPERLTNPDSVRRFQREMQAAAQLSHPNFVMVFDADLGKNTHFFAMEYVDGPDLRRVVKEKGPLPIDTACDYVRQVAAGLQYAHERGLIHRDIKPSNLILAAQGSGAPVVKILDMGLARLAEWSEESALTHDGKVVGTPDYIAPEQATNSHAADIRADLYSLGCTFHFLLTGKVPFPGGGSVMEKLMKHQIEEPVPVESLRPEVPEKLRAILRRLIARRPEYRFQTPAELIAALDTFQAPGAAEPGTKKSIGREKETVMERWFYSHGGQTHGPLTVADIRVRAAHGELMPEDRIWPEGVEPEFGVEAAAAIDFAALAPPAARPPALGEAPASSPAPAKVKPGVALPPWLADVERAEQSRPKPKEPEKPKLPDWIDDIRRG